MDHKRNMMEELVNMIYDSEPVRRKPHDHGYIKCNKKTKNKFGFNQGVPRKRTKKGRNSICSCGSQIKYKKCCGRNK